MQEIIPAATILLLRDAAASAPEVLMVQRGAQLSFAGGAMVFPGGKIDPGDALVASDRALLRPGPALEADDLIARIAAIRETIEEVGIAPGFDGSADPAMIAAMRQGLAEGSSFAAILHSLSLRLDPYQLHPFARWLPMLQTLRVFDTRFYIAQAYAHDLAVADGSESLNCAWKTAQGHLESADGGGAHVIFPTRRNLERIALATSFADAVDRARRIAPATISPWIEERDGKKHLCIPEDQGYPITSQPVADVRRG